MLSIASGHSAGYLTGSVGQGRESYYTGAVDSGEPPGYWSGAGAQALGLSGEVDHEVMHAVYERFADPRDPSALDPATAHQGAVLGRPPKKYRSADEVVSARVEAYSTETGSTPLPEQIQAWRIEAERDTPKAVMFHDLTYSPVKSVTVLHTAFERCAYEAGRAGDTERAMTYRALADEVAAAVRVANGVMLDRMAFHGGYARTGRHGTKSSTGRWVDTHGFTVASFFQHTSRDHDPQLHIHNAVLNRVECPDGQWRALDSKALYAAKQGAGAVADRVLEAELTRRLGVTWSMRADGVAREIDGIDQDVMDLFSTRSRTLTKKAQELINDAEARFGRQLSSLERDRLRRQASMATRRAKTHEGESREEILDRWDAQLGGEVAGGLGRIGDEFITIATTQSSAGGSSSASTSWSPELVIAQAIEACHTGGPDGATTGRATFGRSELTRQIMDALPDNLGPMTPAEVVELAESLTDRALAGDGVVATSGLEHGSEPTDSRLDDGRAATVAPGSQRWAGAGHLRAEIALLDSAGLRGRASLARDVVEEWLDDAGADLGLAQREAVAGLATTDAALSVLIGPAGTGKSYTAGTLAALWAERAGGRVVGVATAQVAAHVLVDDGVTDSANVAAFLTAQRRLESGRTLEDDERWRLSARDVLLVDEASMLDTAALTQLRDVVERAGARMVLMGDPHQLGAVGAGGMMRTAIDHGASTFTLSEVRRFTQGWERDASLRLRDGDPDVVLDYDAKGRIVEAGTREQAIAAAARAAAADRVAGRSTLIVTGTNADAAQAATAVREHLVALGLVAETGVVLGRDGTTAGVGDLVQARRIDRGLGLTNRETYTVTAHRDDGGLDAISTRTGRPVTIPAGYVEQHLTLGYAGTAHAAQGATLDTCHALIGPEADTAGAYVALTRGRESNIAWTITDTGNPDQPPVSGAAVLSGLLVREDDDQDASAVEVTGRDTERRGNAAALVGLIEDETRIAGRDRLDRLLDQLVHDRHLDGHQRARFCADQGSEHLARLLRAHEHAGTDPAELLREAVTARALDSAVSVAQVVATRIDHRHPLPVPTIPRREDVAEPDQLVDHQDATNGAAHEAAGKGDGTTVAEQTGTSAAGTEQSQDDAGLSLRLPAPSGAGLERRRHLDHLAELLEQRRDDLGRQAADPTPGWAVATLGPVPDTAAERQTWQERAGTIAAVREATGWDHPEQALGRCPGVSAPEKRALWHRAYAAAGMPEHRRPEADMSDGRLLVRAAAATREETHAPAHVHDLQRRHHQAAAEHDRDAQLAAARGDHQAAEQHRHEAETAREAAARLDQVAAARAEWLAATLETREAGRAAREELARRGIHPDQRSGRVTAEEWLAAERAVREADDAWRPITEADLTTDADDLDQAIDETGTRTPSADAAPTEAARHAPPAAGEPAEDRRAVRARGRVAAGQSRDEPAALPSAAAAATTVEVAAAVASAEQAREQLDDRASHDQAEPFADDYLIARRRDEEVAATAGRAAGDDLGAV